MIDNELSYNNLTATLNVEIKNENKADSYSASIRIAKDSVIWLSLRLLGIEGLRLCITNDSIKMINRTNNTYYYKDYESFAKKFDLDIDYKSIQAMLTNSFFFYPSSDDKEDNLINNFRSCADKNYYCMSSLSKRNTSKYFSEKEKEDTIDFNKNNSVFQIVKVIPDIYKIKNIYLENYLENQSIYISYDDFMQINEKYFPQKMEIEIISDKFSLFLNLFISKIELNKEDITYPIKYTKKMTAIDL